MSKMIAQSFVLQIWNLSNSPVVVRLSCLLLVYFFMYFYYCTVNFIYVPFPEFWTLDHFWTWIKEESCDRIMLSVVII